MAALASSVYHGSSERETEILGGEAASQREAPLPPDPLLPKSGWRSGELILLAWFRLKGEVLSVEVVSVHGG